MEIEIHGDCDPRFKQVRDEFEEGFHSRDEIGASFAVTLNGQPIIDLWGGYADPARTRPWKKDTIANVYSVTKGMTALCAHHLADQGLLDLDAPVTRYWPEYAAAGKGHTTVAMLLSHRSGLQAIKAPLPPEALYDWNAMTTALAAAEPWFTPGEEYAEYLVVALAPTFVRR
jgi:CubicO group peptidase (beta-lactamase class C family)